MRRPFFSGRRFAGGWSLAELSIVLVIAAVLVYASIRFLRPVEAQAFQQAERLRNDVRHIQMLALTWNRPLGLTVAATSYQVCCLDAAMTACVTEAAPSPCTKNPVDDPGRGKPFLVDLEAGLNLAGPALNFDTLGRPRTGAALRATNATFDITGGTPRSVVVAPITGFAAVQ